jgi:putative oxidoreductase
MMMQRLISIYDRLVRIASGPLFEGMALLVTRLALAGIFWRSGRTKVEEGTWLQLSDVQLFLFESDFSGVPIPPSIAAPMALYAETLFPILLVLGLATRFSAISLLIMTLVIQFFVFPEAWWSVHILWAAMAAILISRGPGLFSLDAIIGKLRSR